jgi:hypothetical protein
MAAGVRLICAVRMFQDMKSMRMRVLAGAAVMLLGFSVSGVAQNYSKGAGSSKSGMKEPKSTAAMKGSGANASSSEKNLQNIEHQQVKSAGKSDKTARAPKQVAMKPEKSPNNPPINFGGKSDNIGTTKQPSNPYKGRLKQKGGKGSH